MNKLILALIVSLLVGCVHIQDHNSFGSYARGPDASNNFTGELIVYAFDGKTITYENIKQQAELNCYYLGGIQSEPYIYMKNSSQDGLEGYYKYQCKGPQPVNYAPAPVNNSPTKQGVSIDQAKQQCKDLGFKLGTEKFGNCVLELSK